MKPEARSIAEAPGNAPIAKEPAYQSGFEQARAAAELFESLFAPGEMIGFLGRRLAHGRRTDAESRAPSAWP